MPTPDEQVIVDGQRAVAVTEVSGDFIYDGGATDAYCIVNDNGTAQRALKVAQVGEGGGGGGTVDQTYDPTSTNAQSGTAVAEAVSPALKNTATATGSLVILGTPTWGTNSIAIGNSATVYAHNAVAIGQNTSITNGTGVAIGNSAKADGPGVGIGNNAKAQGFGSIQLGEGTNSTANTMQVWSYQMLDGTTGKIPMARLPIVQCTQAEYDALVSGGTVDSNTIYCIVPA